MTNAAESGLATMKWSETSYGEATIGLGLDEVLDDVDTASILDRMTGRYTGREHLSEGRSTVLPSRSNLLYDGIKIKGAGLLGKSVDFNRRHDGDFDLPFYDFEGNYTPDKSRSYQGAFAGGMTYQQTVNEYRVSRYLTEKGFDTYPPIGYGYLRKGGATSWFCLLNAPYQPYWQWNSPDYDRELVEEVPSFTARAQARMRDLGLLLVLFGATNVHGRLVRKDLHSARLPDCNDSFISRACYYFFDINFILYTFAHPYFETRIPGWVEKAWCGYVGGLCHGDPEFDDVKSFKEKLVKLKLNNHSTLEERMDIIRSNGIASSICRQFMTDQEQMLFL